MSDASESDGRKNALSEQEILQLTKDIDFESIKRRVQESESFRDRHRVSQEKLDIEISV